MSKAVINYYLVAADKILFMAAEGGGDIVRFTYTGADGEVIPWNATHIFVKAKVIREEAFRNHRNIVEVICHEDVEKIENHAFQDCPSLRRVVMRGVKIVERFAFYWCEALEDVECDKLEIIDYGAFVYCTSLRSINLPSARVVGLEAFLGCKALSDVKFGSKLERIEERTFQECINLERITIPLKDGLFEHDDTFRKCDDLSQVDLVKGEVHEIIAALHLEEWRNDMIKEIDSINQILPGAYAGEWDTDDAEEDDVGDKAREIRRWIRLVLRKIIRYQAEHRRLLDDAASTLGRVFSQDIVMNNVLPFLELPPYTFDVGGDDEEEEEDSDDEMQLSESSLREEEED